MYQLIQYRRLREEARADLNVAQQQKQPLVPSSGRSSRDEESVLKQNDNMFTTREVAERTPGVTITQSLGAEVFVVGWKENDPNNPRNWSMPKKWMATITCCILAIAMSLLTSVEGPVQESIEDHYNVNPMAGSMITGIFLIGIAFGSLFSGPLSETFGRNAIYFSNMAVVLIFIMASALAPNFGSALAFRFLCALFAASPMTVIGGTIGDIWSPMQLSFSLPFLTFAAYTGPILGPVVSAYTPQIGYIWASWISMIIVGAALAIILLFQPETYGPVLLEWRAKHMRELSGDRRYRAEHASSASLSTRLLTNSYRPFTMIWTEPIILVFTFYLVLLYFVLFTFLTGYPYIFTRVYGISRSLTFIIWAAMMPGVFVAMALIPFVHRLTMKAAQKAKAAGSAVPPEVSLYWAMAGASIFLPISLFWMAWTCFPEISIWSPIIASGFFGYALVCIFTTSYMYIIVVYLDYAASALGFMTFARYLISGALCPASIRMYDVLGPHWALTIVGIVGTFMAPVPYILYKHGHKVRAISKYAQNKN